MTIHPDDIRSSFEIELAIGEYHDLVILPTLKDIPDQFLPGLRAGYVRDVKNNPITLWQIAKWHFVERGGVL